MIKRILMPVDGSENSEHIQGWVEGVVKSLGAEIVAITVVNPDKIALTGASGPRKPPVVRAPLKPRSTQQRAYIDSTGTVVVAPVHTQGIEPEHPQIFEHQLVDMGVDVASRHLWKLVDRMQSAGCRATKTVEIGDPATEIVKNARDLQIDLIAMATHRESTLARGILGSVTDRVLQTSSVPVMTIRPGDDLKPETRIPDTVLVPLDGSALAESAVPIASLIAEKTGAKIVFVRVSSVPYYSSLASAGVGYTRPLSSQELADMAGVYLQPFVTAAGEAGLTATAHTPTGETTSNIMSAADQSENTLIVMSTRGASGLKRWILGSITDKLVRTSGHPVLVVPPPFE